MMRGKICYALLVLSVLLNIKLLSNEKVEIVQVEENKQVELNSNILITAAHLPEVDGYTLLYKDEKGGRDTAYYLRNDRQYTTIDFQHVVVDGLGDCVVDEVYSGGFIITTPDKNLINTGLSGSRVKNLDGKDIGFISSLLQNGRIDCKTLE